MAKSRDFSIVEFVGFMQSCQSDLEGLRAQRDKLATDLAAFDAKLGAFRGGAARRGRPPASGAPTDRKVRRKKPKRAKNAQSLPAVLTDILKGQKKGMLLGEIADKVRATGFKSNSANFNNVVYQTLYNKKAVFERDAESGMWKLKG